MGNSGFWWSQNVASGGPQCNFSGAQNRTERGRRNAIPRFKSGRFAFNMLLLRSLVDDPSVTQASETGSFLTQGSIKPSVGFTACRVPS